MTVHRLIVVCALIGLAGCFDEEDVHHTGPHQPGTNEPSPVKNPDNNENPVDVPMDARCIALAKILASEDDSDDATRNIIIRVTVTDSTSHDGATILNCGQPELSKR